MPEQWTDKFSFNTGAVFSASRSYFVLTDDALAQDQMEHAFFLHWDSGNWGSADVLWSSPSVTVVDQPKRQIVAIGEWGEVKVFGSGELFEEEVVDGESRPKERGTLRCVRTIGGVAYAVGMDRQVYRRDGEKKWTCIDATMRPKQEDGKVAGFEGIDGFDGQDIYTVGWRGVIWHFDGSTWKQEDSPTNIILTNVCCAGDGNVYACGRRGLLLRGRSGHGWEAIDHTETNQDFWGLAWYKGQLYVASNKRIYTLSDEALDPVDMGEDFAESCRHLRTGDGILVSIGAKDIMSFDGTTWTRID